MSKRAGIDLLRDRKCPFCASKVDFQGGNSSAMRVECAVCGTYRIDSNAATVMGHWDYSEEQWAGASYRIRRLVDHNDPILTQQLIREILDTAELPKPAEAMDATVVWLAEHSRWPGDVHRVTYPEYRSILGAVDTDAFNSYVDWLIATGWVTFSDKGFSNTGAPFVHFRLSPSGWARHKELTTSGKYSREAFMAMPFADAELDTVFKDHFVPAVKRAGFRLRRNIDAQPAGLIDDLMRVQIRTARFLIADLTHHNRGAYWEAGFAEGLSKPVIYTCREDVFNHADLSKRTHFDTNHLATVVWNPATPNNAANRLTAMIRATLPSDADLED